MIMTEQTGRARSFLRRVFFLGQNRISTAGAVLTTAAAVTMIGLPRRARAAPRMKSAWPPKPE